MSGRVSAHVDHYEALGLDESASLSEIKQAYRRLVRLHHPDVNPMAQTAVLFRNIQEAYEALRDPDHRRVYDQQIREREKQAPYSLSLTFSHTTLLCSEEPQMLYVLAEVAAKPALTRQAHPIELCVALDRSTSMEGPRLQSAVAATLDVARGLGAHDTWAVVAFSDRAEVVRPPQSGPAEVVDLSRLRGMNAGGGTEIAQGLAKSLDLLRQVHRPGNASHVLLLTDGYTYGDEERCMALAQEARRQQVTISTFGVGVEWNEAFLDRLALLTGGKSFYVDAPEHLAAAFANLVRDLSDLVCLDLEAACWVAPEVTLEGAFLVSPQLLRLAPGPDQVMPVGSLGRNAPSSALLEILVGSLPSGPQRIGTFQIKARMPTSGQGDGETSDSTVALRRPIRVELRNKPLPPQTVPLKVLNAAQRAALFKLEEQAGKDLEKGNVADASRRLRHLATHMSKLGEEDLARTVFLEAEQVASRGKTSPDGQKRLHYGTRSLRSWGRGE